MDGDASGDHVRHRLSRAGNRQINRVLRIMATVQLRNPASTAATTTARSPPGRLCAFPRSSSSMPWREGSRRNAFQRWTSTISDNATAHGRAPSSSFWPGHRIRPDGMTLPMSTRTRPGGSGRPRSSTKITQARTPRRDERGPTVPGTDSIRPSADARAAA